MNLDARKMFSTDNTSRTSSNGIKLRRKQVKLYCTESFYVTDVVKGWNKLLFPVVQCDRINSFKRKLDYQLLNQDIL